MTSLPPKHRLVWLWNVLALAALGQSGSARGLDRQPTRPAGQIRPELYTAGASYLIGGAWFQYLGRSEAGAERWLYPHLDGVFEIFQGRPEDGTVWDGNL